jgi:hypothetical protein
MAMLASMLASALLVLSSLFTHKQPVLLSSERVRAVEALRENYGIPGLTIAMVATPEWSAERKWISEVQSFGTANARLDLVTDQVSRFPM